jgi:ring-1,2-phenylacetyl-CoA epoxidase subunit PaaC
VTDAAEVLALADDALVAAQRLAEWCARAPELEEDIALANIALDQLGAARLFLTYAGELEGAGRDEDALAYLRDAADFRNCLLVELPNGDFAMTIGKLLFLAAYQRLRYAELASGPDEHLAAIAAKAVKESAYHVDHAARWTIRLGDGTAESHRRMQAAVDALWPYTVELTGQLFETWLGIVETVLAEATLRQPVDDTGGRAVDNGGGRAVDNDGGQAVDDGGARPSGGRTGRHTDHLRDLLEEMQVLHRAHPGAVW